VTANFKLDIHELCRRKLDWDDTVPLELLPRWVRNMTTIQGLKEVRFNRSVIPADAVSPKVDLLVSVDASQQIAVASIHGRVLLKDGSYSCRLVMARSKIVADLTVPKAELKAAVMGAISCDMVKKNLGEMLGEVMYVTDSTICLHWINQDDRPLQTAVRNGVIEVRRFSDRSQWFHVDTSLNIADLGTREAEIQSIQEDSEWQCGKSWMTLPRAAMPVKTAAEIVLTAEEKRAAAAEMRAQDIRGHSIHIAVDKLAERYSFSNYILDPCRFSWSKCVRILALVFRAVKKWKSAIRNKLHTDLAEDADHGNVRCTARIDGHQAAMAGEPDQGCLLPDVGLCSSIAVLLPEEVKEAENYYFRKATKEVEKFSKPKDYKYCSEKKDGILLFTGRLLDNSDVHALETVMFDLNPASFYNTNLC
jgi:hypothetical protein